jgi:hypothetical protein
MTISFTWRFVGKYVVERRVAPFVAVVRLVPQRPSVLEWWRRHVTGKRLGNGCRVVWTTGNVDPDGRTGGVEIDDVMPLLAQNVTAQNVTDTYLRNCLQRLSDTLFESDLQWVPDTNWWWPNWGQIGAGACGGACGETAGKRGNAGKCGNSEFWSRCAVCRVLVPSRRSRSVPSQCAVCLCRQCASVPSL